MAKIDGYRGKDGEIILVAPDMEKSMFKLPSGAIHIGNVNLAELTLMFERMNLEFIGEVYAEFDSSKFDSICLQLCEEFRASHGGSVPNGAPESRDASP